jgi:hypothetical protein
MHLEKLIRFIRTEMIDNLVNDYCDAFDEISPIDASDEEYRNALEFWSNCDEKQKESIRFLMLFASQNSTASVLSLIDNSSFCYEAKNELGLTDFSLEAKSEGKVVDLSVDLVNEFWLQEENES